ncbi:MAG: adenylyl-sulfate kinase [Alphaproteobacteria bacterium 32-64-14]|nr:MAG: adenylyl-sulfate kinase [Alphaproteobacteria bacterium 32-64-14]
MATKVTPLRKPAEAPRPSVRELASAEKGVLRFITCGSVDDGKSTLIGRLLYDTKLIFEDQLASLKKDSIKHGTQGENIDFALLLDGLEAEREQGITIDVAYRFFSTDKRKFIVADTPGHEQYTRNMATGASTADLAIILIDARKGVLPQTKRHTYIANMLGVRHVVLAVNKMDLADYSRARFHEIVASYLQIAEHLGFESITPIPMSALKGENITTKSEAMAWHDGPTLIEHLETIEIADERASAPFRLPVQWVNRPNLDFRGFSGAIVSGSVKPGDTVVVARSGKQSKVKALVTADGDLPSAGAGQAVTLVIEDEIDASRGDVFATPDARPEVSNQFTANILWMHEDALTTGHAYVLKIGAQTVQATVTGIRHKIDINTLDKMAGHALALNETGFCNVSTNQPIVFDAYKAIRESGGFILIDRFTNQTVGAGMIDFSLSRATNVHRQAMDVTKTSRSLLKGHKPVILDRVENIRRIGEVAKLFVDAGLIVTASFISPFRAERDMVRGLVDKGEFFEIFVDTPLNVAEERDPKGLYKKARAGQIRNFTGIDSPYEPPVTPELLLDTAHATAEALADQVIDSLRAAGIIGGGGEQGVDFSI